MPADLATRLAAAEATTDQALNLYDRAQQALIDHYRVIGGFSGQYTPEYFPHLAPLKAAFDDAMAVRSVLRAEMRKTS